MRLPHTQTAPLGFVTGAINTVSRAFVFTTSLCLGAVLSRGPGPGSRTLGWKTIASVVFIRLVLVPIVGESRMCVLLCQRWYLPPLPSSGAAVQALRDAAPPAPLPCQAL